jgi:hypothetical protein
MPPQSLQALREPGAALTESKARMVIGLAKPSWDGPRSSNAGIRQVQCRPGACEVTIEKGSERVSSLVDPSPHAGVQDDPRRDSFAA